MRALETIGVSLIIIAFAVGTLLVLMGGPNYHGGSRHPDHAPRDRDRKHPLRH